MKWQMVQSVCPQQSQHYRILCVLCSAEWGSNNLSFTWMLVPSPVGTVAISGLYQVPLGEAQVEQS